MLRLEDENFLLKHQSVLWRGCLCDLCPSLRPRYSEWFNLCLRLPKSIFVKLA